MTENKEKIQHKALELFRRYGIRSVTMDEIASQCGISKKTLYQHFEDKDSLVLSIVEALIEKSEGQCEADTHRCQNALHEIFLSMDMMRDLFEGVNPSMLYDLHKYHNRANARFQTHKQQFMAGLVKQNLERGIAEGLYRPEINVNIIVQLHLHTMALLFESDQFADSRISVYEWQTEMMLHYMYGLATPKGIKLIEKYKQQRLKPIS
jgi:AcrR family transcriptional regulator